MMSNIPAPILALNRVFMGVMATAAICTGCAITEAQERNKATEGRIGVLEADLKAAEQKQRALASQRDTLLSDLKGRELTVTELKQRLDAIRNTNNAAPALTAEQRQRRDERARQLTDATNQAQVLEQDTTLSQQEKAKRLAALKAKTQKMLELLVVG